MLIGRNQEHFCVLSIPISVTSLSKTLDKIEIWSKDDIGRYICVREVASLMVCREDSNLVQLHYHAALVVPDGMPLVWIGKWRGYDIERTCGPDLFDLVIKNSPKNGLKHYFFGGKEGIAEKLALLCKERYPDTKIVGFECPSFSPLTDQEDAEVVERIKTSGADVVWVGISSPKQDIWMRDHVGKLPQTLIGVGAAFDFHTGEVKRAPKWMQKIGLESVFRLLSEPKRLWRRYLILVPKFVCLVALGAVKKQLKSQ